MHLKEDPATPQLAAEVLRPCSRLLCLSLTKDSYLVPNCLQVINLPNSLCRHVTTFSPHVPLSSAFPSMQSRAKPLEGLCSHTVWLPVLKLNALKSSDLSRNGWGSGRGNDSGCRVVACERKNMSLTNRSHIKKQGRHSTR